MKIIGIIRAENDELIKAENGSISIIEERLQPQPRKIPPYERTYCGCLLYLAKLSLFFMLAIVPLLLLFGTICKKEYGNVSDIAEYHTYYPKVLQCSLLMKSVHKQEMVNQTTVLYDTSPNYALY